MIFTYRGATFISGEDLAAMMPIYMHDPPTYPITEANWIRVSPTIWDVFFLNMKIMAHNIATKSLPNPGVK